MSIKHCPCDISKEFQKCCKQVHLNHALAKTPEVLMRARYSAYVTGNKSFLLSSWDFKTRPDDLKLSLHTKWISLEILDSTNHTLDKSEGAVTFKAIFVEKLNLYTLTEKSQFVKHSNRWFYKDGKTELKKSKLKSSAPCPCKSGKKFKRCCLNSLPIEGDNFVDLL